MSKRKSLKGKGADIFLASDHNASMPEEHNAGIMVKAAKATFYLPADLIDELDVVYLDLRQNYRNKKVSKSEIVTVALQKSLTDYAANHKNSALVKQLAIKK